MVYVCVAVCLLLQVYVNALFCVVLFVLVWVGFLAFVIVLALVGGGCMVFCLYLMFVCFCWSFSCLVGFELLFVCVGCLIWCLLYIWLVGYFLWWVACCCCFAFSVIARCWLVYAFVVGVCC